jgi:flavodoxin I
MMRIALVYCSKTGNTEELVMLLYKFFLKQLSNVHLYRIDEFPINQINRYDAIVIGSYTWGDGNIPHEIISLYHAFESQDVKKVITGVVGTGDRFYPKFCGAVDEFRDMLFVHTHLAVTMKVELSPQMKDMNSCWRFVHIILDHLRKEKVI